jgi:hypothetical protein
MGVADYRDRMIAPGIARISQRFTSQIPPRNRKFGIKGGCALPVNCSGRFERWRYPGKGNRSRPADDGNPLCNKVIFVQHAPKKMGRQRA